VAQRVVRRVGLHHAQVQATKYGRGLDRLRQRREGWAYRQDQLPSTHPIAADIPDLEAVEVNFDGITYAKGASVLKQLVAWVGEEAFLAGLRAYFKPTPGATRADRPARRPRERPRVATWRRWSKEWLETSGVNTLTPEVDDEGRFTSRTAVVQSAPPSTRRCAGTARASALRPSAGGAWSARTSIELDVVGERTEVRELVGREAAGPAAGQRRRPHLREDPAGRALAGHARGAPATLTTRCRGPCAGGRLGHDP
jgi:aminopeptidase N